MKESLRFAAEVMAMKLDPDNKHFPKILATKQAIASSMLTATTRVRDGLLKPGTDDGFAAVRRALDQAEQGDAFDDGADMFD